MSRQPDPQTAVKSACSSPHSCGTESASSRAWNPAWARPRPLCCSHILNQTESAKGSVFITHSDAPARKIPEKTHLTIQQVEIWNCYMNILVCKRSSSLRKRMKRLTPLTLLLWSDPNYPLLKSLQDLAYLPPPKKWTSLTLNHNIGCHPLGMISFQSHLNLLKSRKQSYRGSTQFNVWPSNVCLQWGHWRPRFLYNVSTFFPKFSKLFIMSKVFIILRA